MKIYKNLRKFPKAKIFTMEGDDLNITGSKENRVFMGISIDKLNSMFYLIISVSDERFNIFSEKQELMVINHLSKRLNDLNLLPMEYYDFLNESYVSEKEVLVSILTTHYSFFELI